MDLTKESVIIWTVFMVQTHFWPDHESQITRPFK